MVNIGDKLTLSDGREAIVEAILGNGGCGCVYKVTVANEVMVLKLYDKDIKNVGAIKNGVAHLIEQRAPSVAFEWPEALVEDADGSFGYVMRLRPDGYEVFSKFLKGKVQFTDMHIVIFAALNISNAFTMLHKKGLCCFDINDANLLIHPDTGDVLFVDVADNVAPYHAKSNSMLKVGYAAPELFLGSKTASVFTDRFLLAVFIFELFVEARPFDGKMTNFPDMGELYLERNRGLIENPVFIFHPTDDRNRPIPLFNPNASTHWLLLPKYIQNAFTQTFVNAIKDSGNDEDSYRTTETEWLMLLARLRDEMICCPKCGCEIIYSFNGLPAKCHNQRCGYTFPPQIVLTIGKSRIVIYPGMKLYGHHIGNFVDWDKEIGVVVRNKRDANLLGIRNTSDANWQEIMPSGNKIIIEKNMVIRALDGNQLDFGGQQNGVFSLSPTKQEFLMYSMTESTSLDDDDCEGW